MKAETQVCLSPQGSLRLQNVDSQEAMKVSMSLLFITSRCAQIMCACKVQAFEHEPSLKSMPLHKLLSSGASGARAWCVVRGCVRPFSREALNIPRPDYDPCMSARALYVDMHGISFQPVKMLCVTVQVQPCVSATSHEYMSQRTFTPQAASSVTGGDEIVQRTLKHKQYLVANDGLPCDLIIDDAAVAHAFESSQIRLLYILAIANVRALVTEAVFYGHMSLAKADARFQYEVFESREAAVKKARSTVPARRCRDHDSALQPAGGNCERLSPGCKHPLCAF